MDGRERIAAAAKVMVQQDKPNLQKLVELEAEWSRLLPQCLEQCAQGRAGLFAKSKEADWPEAERLRGLAQEITALRGLLGAANPVCELFLHYCSLRYGPNVRGEPKMAAEFLEELKDMDGSR